MSDYDSTVTAFREAAAHRVEAVSLRGVAREIGMSPTGLKKLLLGAPPYAPTMRKLRRWYLNHACLPTGEVSGVDAAAAVEVLVHDLPGEVRRRAADRVLAALGEAYDASGRIRPRWVAELRVQYGGGRAP